MMQIFSMRISYLSFFLFFSVFLVAEEEYLEEYPVVKSEEALTPYSFEETQKASVAMQTKRWYCKHCGSQNPDSSSVCGNCGKRR
jgi:hypothetical protein